MTKLIRIFLVAALAFSGALYGAGVATADVENTDAANTQEGDNETDSEQNGSAESGDAVGGQVTGIVSSGDASVDATNVSEDVDVETGDADAENDAATFTGQNVSDDVAVAADINNARAVNLQEGDNETDYSQSANAASGDGVGGQVIGAVTSAGGSADIVAANTSEDVDIDTGDAFANNEFAAFVGQNVADDVAIGGGAGGVGGGTPTAVSDITNVAAFNVQEGDNELSSSQAADAASGDGVGGQVIGAVSAGDTSIDATNVSEDVDIDTGDAEATNAQAAFVGQNFSDTLAIAPRAVASPTGGFGPIGQTPTPTVADIDNVQGLGGQLPAFNVQEGDNSGDLSQAADAASGDGVGGQVIGAVTSAGGSADIVADNTSEDVDVETGDALADNANAAFVGQNVANNDVAIGGGAGGVDGDAPTPTAVSDITNVRNAVNLQEGDNDLDGSQDASAASGDGVGGQVLGVVSAGDASIDATNVSEDVDAETGEATAENDAASFVGQNAVGFDTIVAADITNARAFNLQEGDNERSFGQSADAASGDAVGGQVAGVVTSAGGSADAVLDNTSEDVNGETGEVTFDNDDAGFVGQNFNFFGDLLVV